MPFNAIFAKVPGNAGVPNNCEIWIQGPEPSAIKVADAAVEPANPQINGLQLDVWYDIYAKNTTNAASGHSYIFSTAIFGPLPPPPCCGNPVAYHIWNARNFLDGVGPLQRDTAGGFHHASAQADIAPGATKWLMSVRVTAPTNTTQPAKPVPVPPGGGTPTPTPTVTPPPPTVSPPPGGGGGDCLGFLPFPCPDLSFMTTEMWIIAGAATGLVVLAAVMGGGGGDD
jgi:hypothetical protein